MPAAAVKARIVPLVLLFKSWLWERILISFLWNRKLRLGELLCNQTPSSPTQRSNRF